MTALEFHPLANLFPLIEGSEFDELVADIAGRGLQEPDIVLLDGQILDGRNRYRALEILVERGAVEAHELDPARSRIYSDFIYSDCNDPLAFVLSRNLHRRQLSQSQRAMVAARVETLRHGGDRKSGDQDAILHLDRADAAKVLNVSPRSVASAAEIRDHGSADLQHAVDRGEASVSAAAAISRRPADEQERILAEIAQAPDTRKAFARVVKDLRYARQAHKKQRRDDRERQLADGIIALPQKRYGVILADPEWQFDVWSDQTGQDRAAKNHYPTSSTEVIAGRPVATIAADDCVLFLWATAPKLPDALTVMAAWGFAYRTHAVWLKDKVGTGYWFRSQHELLLLGTRGDLPAPAMGTQFRSALAYDVGAHSAKPPFAHEIAEAYFPNLPKIELNARRRRPGWDAWGNEADRASQGDDRAPRAVRWHGGKWRPAP